MLLLVLRQPPSFTLDLEGITPDRLGELSLREIANLKLGHGNRTELLGDWFTVTGSASPRLLRIEGDCSRINNIGSGMKLGEITIDGHAGAHTGARMSGGQITIRGNVGNWLGAEMQAGSIYVHGDAGDQAGSAYRGSRRGICGGMILISGNAGHEAGQSMRRGLIACGGKVGDFAGANLIAGTIVALGGFGRGLGTGMKRGTLFSGESIVNFAPSFYYSCELTSNYLNFLINHLNQVSFHGLDHLRHATMHCYRGDILHGGRGELYFPLT